MKSPLTATESRGIQKGERRLILDTILLGIVGALSAQLFQLLLHASLRVFLNFLAGFRPPMLPSDGGTLQQVIGAHGLWLIPVATTLGGLLAGLVVYSFAPEAEGHGTDTAVKSFHRQGGYLRARVPPLKMLASALTIGSGGAAGREGPTALISAGIGSVYGTWTHRDEAERRLLVLIGMASGLSAIFRSPVGTAIFAIEVLYGGMELEAGALIYTLLGSVVAYAVNGLLVGWDPLFQVPSTLAPPTFLEYGWYAVLGVAAGLVATLLPVVFYGLRDAFRKLPIPPAFKPAIGGLGVGLLALKWPQILAGGYGWIQEAINGQLSIELMTALIFVEMIALALTISSGGSGGVFAPSLYVGAMLGGTLARLFNQPIAEFVVVGMAAVFGGAARVPIATMLMVTEMTGGYHLLVPAALAVVASFIVQGGLARRLKYQSLYEAQVPDRVDSPAHHLDHVEAALKLLREKQLAVPPTVTHLDLRQLLAAGIPVDLPDRKRLLMGVLDAESSYVGKRISLCFPVANQDDVELIAVLRRSHTLLPHTNVRLQAADRLLVIVSPDGQEQLTPHLASAAHASVETNTP
jgi:CIC family chloride channel protein